MASSDWQSSFENVSDRSVGLFRTMKLSDCSFRVGSEDNQKIFKAHKLILSMASPVFEAMFYGLLAETEYPIEIPYVEPAVFQALLEYIYTDRINVENATELCYVAKKYMLFHVFEQCTNYLASILNVQNACRIFEFAKVFDQHNLMESSMKIIECKTSEVLNDPGFIDIEMSTLLTILDMDKLDINSEIELFKVLERYASAKCSHPEEDIISFRQAVKKIRFLLMTPQQFVEEGPANSKLLNLQQKFDLLKSIIRQNAKEDQMPEGFSTSRTARIKHYAVCDNGTNSRVAYENWLKFNPNYYSDSF